MRRCRSTAARNRNAPSLDLRRWDGPSAIDDVTVKRRMATTDLKAREFEIEMRSARRPFEISRRAPNIRIHHVCVAGSLELAKNLAIAATAKIDLNELIRILAEESRASVGEGKLSAADMDTSE